MAGDPQLRWGAIILAAVLGGCAQVQATANHTVEWFQFATRSPGETMETHPKDIWERENCDDRSLPFLRLDRNEVKPSTVGAGDKMNHRFAYTMCPTTPSEVLRGPLRTTINHEGKPIFRDTAEDFVVKPGAWIVDSTIVIPGNAEPGIYGLEVSFAGRTASFKNEVSFVVEK